MRICHVMLATVTLLASCQGGGRSAPVSAPVRSDKLVRAAAPVPGSYLVALADGLGAADASALAARHGATLTRWIPPPVGAALMTADPARAIALAEDASVRFAEEDQILRIASVEWNLDRIDQRPAALDGRYAHTTAGAGVTVYVLDTGVLSTHPELAGRASQVADFVHRAPSAVDCNGHGTHLAAIVAGTSVGVAPAASVRALRVADCDGVAEASRIAEALDWLRTGAERPAAVFIGTTGGPSAVLAAAIDALVESGVAVVGPAGNDAADACASTLGGVSAVITVGAISAVDLPLASSNRGRCVDLYAPGAAVRSAWSDGGYRLAEGTSQAAAHVAGAAALFLEARPDATPAQVTSALVGNATVGLVSGVPLGTPDRLLYTGFIAPALGADSTAPQVAITSPAAGAVVSGDVVVSMTSGATDLASVAVYVDGAWVGADGSPADGLAVTWRTVPWANGSHVVEARAHDAAGNVGTAQVTVLVQNEGNAAWDAALGAPVCASPGERCATGALLAGRGSVGPEANAPSTIHSLCLDGEGGSYMLDESVEAIEVQAVVPGRPFVEGDLVNVDVIVWGYPDYASDRVDLHFAPDAGAPAWSLAGSATIPGPGLHTVRFTYRLPAFPDAPLRPQQAVRATIRYGGGTAVCSDGPYDDHDDLAFAVGAGTPDEVKPAVAIVAPQEGAVISGVVELQASASDERGGGIARVELYVDGSLAGTATEFAGSVFRIAWNADAARLGAHELVAVAYDLSGNSAQSDAVHVVVKDTSAPTVALEAPLAGSTVGGLVRIWAVASDNRDVTKVVFRVGSTLVGTAVLPPWVIDWDSTKAAGEVTIIAEAFDGTNSRDSDPVTVRIDNQTPTVSIAAPAAGAEVQGEIEVAIAASDAGGLQRVDLYAGGAYVDSVPGDGRTTPYVFRWNTGVLENGPVELRARAYDAAGNVTDSAPVAVTVRDTVPPSIAFLGPEADALLRGVVQVDVTATDNGVVTEVDFEAGNSPIGTDVYAPYGVEWNTTSLPDGEVTLRATAYDVAGLVGVATRTVRVDNHGPSTAVVPPTSTPVRGNISVQVTATDLYGVRRVDLWADGALLGPMMRIPGSEATWAYTWATTEFDNRTFVLKAVAADLVGNVAESAPVAFKVSNLTTAEQDAALGVPACRSSAAWCFSGTLLQGAWAAEAGYSNTLEPACTDGARSVYHQTESIEEMRVAADTGGLLPGMPVTVTVSYWAPVANEADQLDVYLAANALDPAWQLLGTHTPAAVGLNLATFQATLSTGPLQAIRANLRFAQPGPAPCSTGDHGDRDDLVFAVGSPMDRTDPTVVLDAPQADGVIGADFVLSATAADDQGIAKVEFVVDGVVTATVLRPDPGSSATYSAAWPTWVLVDGTHDVAVRAHDTSGNVTSTKAVAVQVDNLPNATYDAGMGVPVCSEVASFCDTGQLLEGRGTVGPELNAPNTLGGACADGTVGTYHLDESLDWLRVSSVDGLPLQAGKRVRVEARVWAYDSWGDDRLSIYTTHTPTDPHWTWVATLAPTGPGAQRLGAEFDLPPGGLQAVRGVFAYGTAAAECRQEAYDDNDDVAFAVQYTANAAFDGSLKVPACKAVAAWCDSGSLLDGRGPLGPEANAPNTLGGTCRDGTAGMYHDSPSVDGIRVLSRDGGLLTAGRAADVEITAWGSASYAAERIDLFTCANPSASSPVWTYLGTVRPSRQGAQVMVSELPVTAGTQAVRARMSREDGLWFTPVACGTSANAAVVDDHDDLVFTAN